jgi:hypothetical protein
MIFRWLESTLWFSRKKTLSTPYSWSLLNLTNNPMVPARERSITRFFFPRTYFPLADIVGRIAFALACVLFLKAEEDLVLLCL